MKVNHRTAKIVSLSAIFFLAALTLALIPINIFCVNFPEWITVFLSVIFCGGLIAYLAIFKTRLITKIILPIVFVISAALCSVFPYVFPYWNSYFFKDYKGVILNYDDVISYDDAEKDLNELKHYLKKTHPMFENGLPKEVDTAF